MPENTKRRKLLTRCARECQANRPFARTAVLAKKAKCWKAANNASSGAKSRFPIEGKKIFPADVLRAFDNTQTRASARKNCLLGIESSGSRTPDLSLRRAKKRSPLSASECLQMPKYQRFPPFSDFRISSKNRLFYPVRVSRVLAASNFGGRPFSHPANLTRQSGGSTEQLPCRPRTLRPFSAFGKADVDRLIRRRPLYPTELRNHNNSSGRTQAFPPKLY